MFEEEQASTGFEHLLATNRNYLAITANGVYMHDYNEYPVDLDHFKFQPRSPYSLKGQEDSLGNGWSHNQEDHWQGGMVFEDYVSPQCLDINADYSPEASHKFMTSAQVSSDSPFGFDKTCSGEAMIPTAYPHYDGLVSAQHIDKMSGVSPTSSTLPVTYAYNPPFFGPGLVLPGTVSGLSETYDKVRASSSRGRIESMGSHDGFTIDVRPQHFAESTFPMSVPNSTLFVPTDSHPSLSSSDTSTDMAALHISNPYMSGQSETSTPMFSYDRQVKPSRSSISTSSSAMKMSLPGESPLDWPTTSKKLGKRRHTSPSRSVTPTLQSVYNLQQEVNSGNEASSSIARVDIEIGHDQRSCDPSSSCQSQSMPNRRKKPKAELVPTMPCHKFSSDVD